MCLFGCGKTEATKKVEESIEALLSADEAGDEEIAEVKAEYEALTEEEQNAVKNYDDFTDFMDAYYETVLAGTWYPMSLNLYSPEYIFEPRFSVTLNEDMTCITTNADSGADEGATWKVNEGRLSLENLADGLGSEHGAWSSGSYDLEITYTDGKYRITNGSTHYYQEDDYFAALENIVLDVDCAEGNLSDYFGFTSYNVQVQDEWGNDTPVSHEGVCLKNLLFDSGWYFIGTSDDFLLEVLYPGYTETYTYSDGGSGSGEFEAGSRNLSSTPFSAKYNSIIDLRYQDASDGYTSVSNLTTDSFSFGRGKGHVYFINEKYVKDVRKEESENSSESSRSLAIDTEAETVSFGTNDGGTLWTGWWEDNNQEY